MCGEKMEEEESKGEVRKPCLFERHHGTTRRDVARAFDHASQSIAFHFTAAPLFIVGA